VGESAHFQVTRKPQITFAQSFRMFALLVGWRTGSNLNLRPHATSARRAKRKRLMNGEWGACPLAHECDLAHRWLECVTAPGTGAVVCWCICFTLQSYCRKVRHQHDRICQWRADVATRRFTHARRISTNTTKRECHMTYPVELPCTPNMAQQGPTTHVRLMVQN